MQVTVKLLGGFEVVVDGEAVPPDAWARRDPARLVKLLALAPGRCLHREQVLDALWPEAGPASAANRLHKAAHYVRRATGQATSLVLRGDTVALFPAADVAVDVARFEAAAAAGDTGGIEVALGLYRGPLLPLDPYEEWAFATRQRLELSHRDLLRRAGRYDELAALDPTDELAQVEVMASLLEEGRRSAVLERFELLARALDEELGIGPSAEATRLRDLALASDALAAPAAPAHRAPPRPRHADLATQTVHRCTASDGVRLAYACSGSGPPLVKASNWLSHLDYDWDSPVWRHWWRALSARHTLVRYDERGCGLSDWDVDASSFTLDAWVRDLETVVDTLGLERFPLLGISQGGPIAITYAARHPERVSHVVVFGTCARATWARASEERRRELTALGELIKVSWGSDQPGFRQVYDAKFLPDGPLEAWRAFDELQRRSSTPRNALRLWRAFGSLDCADEARQLDVPTLVLHSTDDQVWSFAEAEELAAMVPGSRLVALPSRNHILQADEPAFAQFVDEVERFLGDT